ncbi:MAG: nucleotidyltransferase domain-containing protein [Chloroflexota bacterium]|nr:nucleotidyltransferase domain-containing protein [Chloroflexota bacterium]
MSLSPLQKVKHTAPDLFSRYPVLFAYLYGSYAAGSAHARSDLDIGIYVESATDNQALGIELDLALALDKALGHIVETEVRVINNLPLTFLGQIITDGILLYSRDENTRVEFEVQVRKKYFDFLPVIQDYHAAYLKTAGC